MKSVLRPLAAGLGLLLVGCGSEFDNFKCTKANFTELEGKVASRLVGKGSSSSSAYNWAVTWNKKLETACTAPVRAKCSPGNTTASIARENGKILGPVNAFGVTGETEVKERWHKEDGGRVPDYDVKYYVSFDKATFDTGMACFKGATN